MRSKIVSKKKARTHTYRTTVGMHVTQASVVHIDKIEMNNGTTLVPFSSEWSDGKSVNVQERVASFSSQKNYFFKLIVNCHGFSFFKSKNPD